MVLVTSYSNSIDYLITAESKVYEMVGKPQCRTEKEPTWKVG